MHLWVRNGVCLMYFITFPSQQTQLSDFTFHFGTLRMTFPRLQTVYKLTQYFISQEILSIGFWNEITLE